MILSTDGNASFASFIYDSNKTVGEQAASFLADFRFPVRFEILRGYNAPSLSQCVQNSFRIDGKAGVYIIMYLQTFSVHPFPPYTYTGNCISTVLPDDMCNLTSYTVTCQGQSSISCRCRQTPTYEGVEPKCKRVGTRRK